MKNELPKMVKKRTCLIRSLSAKHPQIRRGERNSQEKFSNYEKAPSLSVEALLKKNGLLNKKKKKTEQEDIDLLHDKGGPLKDEY